MSPARLKWPLKEQLTSAGDREAEQRLRQRIHDRLSAARPLYRRPSAQLAAAFVAVATVFLIWGGWGWGTSSPPGALLSSRGEAFQSLESFEGQAPQRVNFRDGSSIEVFPGGAVRGLGSNEQKMITLVEQGRALFVVQPGGPRQWTVEAGLLSVEVLGTRFLVERSLGAVRVEVTRGTVLVRSALLKDGVQRVSAGDAVLVRAKTSALPSPLDAQEPGEAAEVSLEELEATPATSGAEKASAVAAVRPTAEELMSAADQARASGDAKKGIAALERLLADYPKDPRGAFARFQLARWYLSEGDALRAETLLNRVARDTGPLSEDAFLRLVELKKQQDEARAATRWAEEYLRRYPSGRHRRLMESVLAP